MKPQLALLTAFFPLSHLIKETYNMVKRCLVALREPEHFIASGLLVDLLIKSLLGGILLGVSAYQPL